MQIRTQLNDDRFRSREDVVQKVLETSDSRQDEDESQSVAVDDSGDFMYIQVSSYRRDLHKKHFKWSLCSIDKLKSNCFSFIKYLLVHSLLLSFQRSLNFIRLKCRHHRYDRKTLQYEPTSTLLYGVQPLVIEANHHRMEASHKSLTVDKSFILFMLLSTTTMTTATETTTHQPHSKTANFYIKLYKILLNLFYEYFNNKMNCHHPCWQQQHQHQQQHQRQQPKIYFNPLRGINALSTKGNVLFVINGISGIDHHHHRSSTSSSSSLRTSTFCFESYSFNVM